MRSYTNEDGKTWTEAERRASYELTKEAIARGEIPSQYELGCSKCGQRFGRIDYHNRDYSHPTKYLIPLCARCHLVYHCCLNNRNQALQDAYDEYIEANGSLPPIRDYNAFFEGIKRNSFMGDLK